MNLPKTPDIKKNEDITSIVEMMVVTTGMMTLFNPITTFLYRLPSFDL